MADLFSMIDQIDLGSVSLLEAAMITERLRSEENSKGTNSKSENGEG